MLYNAHYIHTVTHIDGMHGEFFENGELHSGEESLEYQTVRQMTSLNPAMMMYSNPDLCQGKIKCLVKRLFRDKQLNLTGVVATGKSSTVENCRHTKHKHMH